MLLLMPSLEHLLDLIQLILVLLVFLVKLAHHVFIVLFKCHASLAILRI